MVIFSMSVPTGDSTMTVCLVVLHIWAPKPQSCPQDFQRVPHPFPILFPFGSLQQLSDFLSVQASHALSLPTLSGWLRLLRHRHSLNHQIDTNSFISLKLCPSRSVPVFFCVPFVEVERMGQSYQKPVPALILRSHTLSPFQGLLFSSLHPLCSIASTAFSAPGHARQHPNKCCEWNLSNSKNQKTLLVHRDALNSNSLFVFLENLLKIIS